MSDPVTNTVLENTRYANVGVVTMYFTDSTHATHNITSVGNTVFDNTGKVFSSIDVLGGSYTAAQLPHAITYPDSSSGTCSIFTTPFGTKLILDEKA